MRKLFIGGLTGLFFLTFPLLVGCSGKSSPSTPKMMEVPKEGPQPVGAGGGGGKAKAKDSIPGATPEPSM